MAELDVFEDFVKEKIEKDGQLSPATAVHITFYSCLIRIRKNNHMIVRIR